jgi:hypothetical protein
LHFEKDKPFHSNAANIEAKNAFLWKMLQLTNEHFGKLPELENIKLMELSLYAPEEDNIPSLTKSVLQDESKWRWFSDFSVVRETQESLISKEEEERLMNILQVYKLDISDAKAVTSVLSEELIRQENVCNVSFEFTCKANHSWNFWEADGMEGINCSVGCYGATIVCDGQLVEKI